MKTTILLTTLASIASLQIVSAAYWTVSFGNSPLQNGKYSAKYQYWETSLAAVNDVTVATKLACSFSQSSEDKSLLFNQPSRPYMSCGELINGSTFTIAVRPVGSDTELNALSVAYEDDIPCVIMEYGNGFKTYICSSLMPVVNTPSVNNNLLMNMAAEPRLQTTSTYKTSTTKTATSSTYEPTTTKTAATTTTKSVTTATRTTTNKPTATETSCKSGYKGKRNGQGPNGACCSHSDDCKDTCVKGICGVSP